MLIQSQPPLIKSLQVVKSTHTLPTKEFLYQKFISKLSTLATTVDEEEDEDISLGIIFPINNAKKNAGLWVKQNAMKFCMVEMMKVSIVSLMKKIVLMNQGHGVLKTAQSIKDTVLKMCVFLKFLLESIWLRPHAMLTQNVSF